MDSVAKLNHDKIVAEAKKAKPFAAGKHILRCKAQHPHRTYYVLDLKVGGQFKEYDLNEAQAKELSSVGCRMWIEHGTAKDMKADKKLGEVLGNLKDLDKKGI